MEKLIFEVPAMYADHHVTNVRQLLTRLDGVKDVYASSGFKFVEVTIDPAVVGEEALRNVLETNGYLGELSLPFESGLPVTQEETQNKIYFRHTSAFEQVKETVSFSQVVPNTGRALWPCPGMGPIRTIVEEE